MQHCCKCYWDAPTQGGVAFEDIPDNSIEEVGGGVRDGYADYSFCQCMNLKIDNFFF